MIPRSQVLKRFRELQFCSFFYTWDSGESVGRLHEGRRTQGGGPITEQLRDCALVRVVVRPRGLRGGISMVY